MYNWYRRSSVCYCSRSRSMQRSWWFRKDWSVQELLTPDNSEFYDQNWHYVGDKSDLANQISAVAGIDHQYMTEWDSVSRASIAACMSWASRRHTNRLRDDTYCLMGLFKGNMPLLYGGG